MVSSETNIQKALSRLLWICDHLPAIMNKLDEKEFSERPAPGKWSRKEILGHLVDSAANNHHRLVRGQFEEKPLITYDADKWNAANHYQKTDKKRLVAFWENYNRHLYGVAKVLPSAVLQREVFTSPQSSAMSLEELLVDYVRHLEHHLRQITSY